MAALRYPRTVSVRETGTEYRSYSFRFSSLRQLEVTSSEARSTEAVQAVSDEKTETSRTRDLVENSKKNSRLKEPRVATSFETFWKTYTRAFEHRDKKAKGQSKAKALDAME